MPSGVYPARATPKAASICPGSASARAAEFRRKPRMAQPSVLERVKNGYEWRPQQHLTPQLRCDPLRLRGECVRHGTGVTRGKECGVPKHHVGTETVSSNASSSPSFSAQSEKEGRGG
jgi:hypothetical protein